MTEKDIISRLAEDTESDKLYLLSLQEELDAEMNKKFSRRDFDKIEKLSLQIAEIRMGADMLDAKAQAGISALGQKSASPEKKRKFFFHPAFTAVFCCMAVILVLNTASKNAFGTNFISAIIKYAEGSISFDFSGGENSEPENENIPDSYGIYEECQKHGITPEVPHYIPKNLRRDDVIFESMSLSDDAYFYYSDGEKLLSVTFQKYHKSEDIPPQLIPSDTEEVSVVSINGHDGFMINDGESHTAIYQYQNTVYSYYAQNMDSDEFMSVINSIR